ncbi:BON domain-containing protein [Azospirillum sp. sgz301742]
MERYHVKRLPVLRGGHLVGIVSRANLLRSLLQPVRETAARTDDRIRERLLAEMDAQTWAPRALVDVVVRHGVVDLWGAIFDQRQREALRVAAENVPGVTQVRDHLVWVEPTSGYVVDASDEASGATGLGNR